MDFLPEGTEIPKSASNYMKFTEPENRLRIMGSAIVGYELWINSKPVRRKENTWTMDEFNSADINKFTGEKKNVQYFWAFPVYNYKTQRVEILEITQKTVMRGIENYLKDDDFGKDPKKYDLLVKKEDTEPITYSVMAKPPKAIDPGIAQLYQDMNINLNALYEGKDPFASSVSDKTADEVNDALGAEKIFGAK